MGCAVAQDWEVFPGALTATREAVAADPDSVRWGARLFILDDPHTLVGWGGFKGPPREGTIEIGYAVAPEWEGRGLASEAVHAMLREGFAARDVDSVIAHTLAQRGASVHVLEKAGFVRDGEAPDEDVGTAWRFRLDRPAQFSTK